METIQTNTHVYPGMLCSGIEFFKDENEQLKIVHSGRVESFSEAPYAVVQTLVDALAREIESKNILTEWFPDSNVARLEQFAWCRFGGLDFQSDIKENRLQDGEYHPCPKRGNCPGEGILCKLPLYNGIRLTVPMVKLMKMLCGNDTNEVVAEKMEMPLGSLHELKKKLYELLAVQTKQELALIARNLNLV